jgi:hypothetical protein
MSVRWCLSVGVILLVSVAPAQVRAQNATAGAASSGPLKAPIPRFAHGKKLTATYDSAADSTRLAVTTHKGKYFLTIQRPRLTWSVAYPGRRPAETPPAVVILEFRTQAPQVALNSQLTVSFAGGRRLEISSAGAHSDPGVQTWSHFMRFPVPSPELAEALETDTVSITVGGITERLKADHINALRDLLARVGAWPPGESASGGA